MLAVLMAITILYLWKAEAGKLRIIGWINFAIAIVIRLALIALRISFEYLLKRMERRRLYLGMAFFSFIFSAHLLPFYPIISEIVLIIDAGLALFFLVMALGIKFCIKRQACSLRFGLLIGYMWYIAGAFYGTLITAIAI